MLARLVRCDNVGSVSRQRANFECARKRRVGSSVRIESAVDDALKNHGRSGLRSGKDRGLGRSKYRQQSVDGRRGRCLVRVDARNGPRRYARRVGEDDFHAVRWRNGRDRGSGLNGAGAVFNGAER